jgi:hypothetical protein
MLQRNTGAASRAARAARRTVKEQHRCHQGTVANALILYVIGVLIVVAIAACRVYAQ